MAWCAHGHAIILSSMCGSSQSVLENPERARSARCVLSHSPTRTLRMSHSIQCCRCGFGKHVSSLRRAARVKRAQFLLAFLDFGLNAGPCSTPWGGFGVVDWASNRPAGEAARAAVVALPLLAPALDQRAVDLRALACVHCFCRQCAACGTRAQASSLALWAAAGLRHTVVHHLEPLPGP